MVVSGFQTSESSLWPLRWSFLGAKERILVRGASGEPFREQDPWMGGGIHTLDKTAFWLQNALHARELETFEKAGFP